MNRETERLAEIVAEKHHCLCQLRELGLCQLESIASEDFSQLMTILAGKQRLLAELREVEARLEPFRAQSPESRHWPSVAAREQCAGLVAQCESLLREVIAQEQKSETLLTAQRSDAARRLHGQHDATQARGAYIHDIKVSSGHFDAYSES